jgi:hypothetical protein
MLGILGTGHTNYFILNNLRLRKANKFALECSFYTQKQHSKEKRAN